jgi:sterol desaturase/sphingolipid hydroxylase (fatty acid hydroxylase superfamily)
MLSALGAVAIIFMLTERCSKLRFCPSPFLRPLFLTDVFYLLTGFVAGGSVSAAYVDYGSQVVGATFGTQQFTLAIPRWVSILIALVALDAGNYFAHYLLHRFEALWEFHKIHHSSPRLDWLATFRSHILEQALRRLLAPILLIFLGFPPDVVFAAGAIFIAWAIFNHANLRVNLRFLENALITPRLHRVHHLSNAPTRNLGTIFTCWDRMRGTFSTEEMDEKSGLGNGEPRYPQNWLSQLVEPMRRIGGMKSAAKS